MMQYPESPEPHSHNKSNEIRISESPIIVNANEYPHFDE